MSGYHFTLSEPVAGNSRRGKNTAFFVGCKKRAQLIGAVLLLGLLLPAPLRADNTEQIYTRYKDRILQVRIVNQASGSKASIGSGFVVSEEGLVISNYHVVAQLIDRPDTYQSEYVREDGSSGRLELLAIDVVHDLALLRADTPFSDRLTLAGQAPAKGEPLYSFGNPHDLGLTIVQGTCNGLLEKSLYEKIHFTGSINPGMSGGPALDRHGRVVGVNVATAGNQISFLVPVRYVARLLEKLPPEIPDTAQLVEQIRTQLLANQEQYMQQLLDAPFSTVQVGDYQLPGELEPFIRCWGDTRPKQEALYEKVFKSCATTDDIYLSDKQSVGAVRFSHELYSSSELNPLRFYGFLEKRINQPQLGVNSDKESVGNYACRSEFVSHEGLDSRVVICLRAYKKYSELYDAFFTLMTLVSGDEALHTTLSLSGISSENALRFSQSYLEALKWSH